MSTRLLDLLVRVCALLIALTLLLPWYESLASVEVLPGERQLGPELDLYRGNPLPIIDWVLLALCCGTALRPALATFLAMTTLVSVLLAALLATGDAAEGLSVSVGIGLVAAGILSFDILLVARGASGVDSTTQSSVV